VRYKKFKKVSYRYVPVGSTDEYELFAKINFGAKSYLKS